LIGMSGSNSFTQARAYAKSQGNTQADDCYRGGGQLPFGKSEWASISDSQGLSTSLSRQHEVEIASMMHGQLLPSWDHSRFLVLERWSRETRPERATCERLY
jgi:hypothetical protein